MHGLSSLRLDTEETELKIAAVVVTFNRLNLLKQCVNSIRGQTRRLDAVIVINNSSTDGTLDWLNSQTDLICITQENTGSAGGQYTGIRFAYDRGYDWIWCMDDDTLPNENCLDKLMTIGVDEEPDAGFFCSTVLFTDGSICIGNQPLLRNHSGSRLLDEGKTSSAVDEPRIEVVAATFVSILLNRTIIAEVGFPRGDFFIRYDDVEYTRRISSTGRKCFWVPSSVAVHFIERNMEYSFAKSTREDQGKYYYGLRNAMFTRLYLTRLPFWRIPIRALSILIGTTTDLWKMGRAKALKPFHVLTYCRAYIDAVLRRTGMRKRI